ncbi:MAG: winged helix-turn-helix transcriptional regulator [Archaeoglobaceae archaeon]
MGLQGSRRRSEWSRVLLFYCSLTILFLFFISQASAFGVKPANVTDEELEKIKQNDIDDERKISFWDLPLWIKAHHIYLITLSALAALGLWKYLPILLGRIKSVLKSTKRQRILDYLEWNFGVSIRELEENLNINRSTLRYHLALLERWGKVISVSCGNERLFFSKNQLTDGELGLVTFLRSENKRRILELLSQNGSLSKEEIAELTGINPKNLYYHLNHLKSSGMLEKNGEEFRIDPEQRGRFLSLLRYA